MVVWWMAAVVDWWGFDRWKESVGFVSYTYEWRGGSLGKRFKEEKSDGLDLFQGSVEHVMEARLQTLKAEFESTSMKDSERIDDFSARLASLESRSAALGAVIEEPKLVRKLLTAVPERFLNIVATIEQLVDLKTTKFQEIIGRLKAYEERTTGRNLSSSQDHLLLSYEEWDAKKKNERGRGRGRASGRGRGSGRGSGSMEGGKAPDRQKKDRSKLQCFRCDAYGHFSADCPTRKEEEHSNLTQAQVGEGPTLLMAKLDHDFKEWINVSEEKVFPEKYEVQTEGDNMWYLDTGATSHMTGNKNLFSTLDDKTGGTVRFGDNSCVTIEGRGSILLECKNGEQRLLTDVLYIPYLRSNIFSIGQAEEGGCEIRIKHGTLTMIEQDGSVAMRVPRSANRLYKIKLTKGNPMCLKTEMTDPAWLWHGRLGHLNFDTMKPLKNVVDVVPAITHPNQVCEACLAGKHTMRGFPEQSPFKAEEPFDLITMDICGPISPTTQARNRYMMLIVDDHSRFMWAYMLKAKDEALGRFKVFKAMVDTQFKKGIKTLRTDRGGEFTSREFNNFYEEGISRQLTVPYTPQQNRIVERRNRTILNCTRSILKAMGMPQQFWAEAVRHSIYVLNRLPTKILRSKTPYELLKGRRPNLEHLRVFGCIGHVKIPSNQVKKLDDRSTPMVYLGTEPGTKGYRMLDVEKGSIVVSRDVKFEEHRSWECGTPVGNKEREFEFQFPQVDTDEGTSSSNDQAPFNTNHGTNTDEESDSDFSSPESKVRGRGPPLLGSSAISNKSDPARAPERTYDDSPIQGFKNLEEVYDLLIVEGEPTNFKEAARRKEWEQAMEDEMASIERNNTWTFVNLPKGHRPIGLKWVYKHGVDYDEVFAPVTRLENVRLVLGLAAYEGWLVHHLDVKTAFLYGELNEEVFVKQPEGFEKKGQEDKVYWLTKALYGLKQAPRA
ncbi:hypothetical protein E3N88_24926 [Mikania micrantha]|uniref:Integrase catalytic domain-containing protein n=1 Tax=Mikania micrantha TaxID=192012 RepID=A0A5N6N662_9ASTR|nr:hypothetical protein E3N88_24926 [Mikania micrantha]